MERHVICGDVCCLLQGQTPLAVAAGRGRVSVVELLIRHGAQVNTKNLNVGVHMNLEHLNSFFVRLFN